MYHFERVNKVLPVRLSVCYAIRPQVHQYLKDFQVEAVRFLFLFLAKRESCLFNDESGLGKQVAVAAILDTVAQNKKTLILVHNDDEYVTGWQFHLHVLTSLSVTVINDEQDYLKVSHVYITKWNTLTTLNKSCKENFDIIIVDNRGEMLNNNFCTSLLLKLYERHINIIISSVDVTSDLKLLHNTLRLLGRLQPEYITFNGFKKKFPLTPPIGRRCQKSDIEEYFHQRERLSDYCKTFRLRRCCHQFESDLPLVDKLSYTHNLFVWCQKNNTLQSKNNSVEYILSDAETLVETNSLMDQSNLLSDTFYREIFTVDQFSEDVMPPLLIETDSDNDGHMNSQRKDESVTLLSNGNSLKKLKKTPLCKRRGELNILRENVAHDLKKFKNVRSSGRVTRSMMIITRSKSYNNKNLYSNNKNKKSPKQLNKSVHKINRLQAKKKRVRTTKSKKCRVILHDCVTADFTKKQFNAEQLDNISKSTQMATTAPLQPAGAAAMPKTISFSDNSSEVIYVPPTIINNEDNVTDDIYLISSSHEDLPQLSTSPLSAKLRQSTMSRTTNKKQKSSRKTLSPDLFSTASDTDHLICTQPHTFITNDINAPTNAPKYQINNNTLNKRNDCQHFLETTNQPNQKTLNGTNLGLTETLENAQQAFQHNENITNSPPADISQFNNSSWDTRTTLKFNKITDYLDKSQKKTNFNNHSITNNSNNQQRTPKKQNIQTARNNSLRKKSPKFKTIQTTKLTKWFTNDSPSPPNDNIRATAPITLTAQAKRSLS